MRKGWIAFVTLLVACGGEVASERPVPPVNEDAPPAETSTGSPAQSAVEAPPAISLPHAACDALVMASLPDGVFTVDEPVALFSINPVDVYAEQWTNEADGVQRLRIALTETPRECAFRSNRLSPRYMNELRLTIERPLSKEGPADFEPGTYAVESIQAEAGERCITEEELVQRGGWSGTAGAGASVSGNVTITNRTATMVEGTFHVVAHDGKVMQGTFAAPICEHLPVTEKLTCCVR
jgi:hypothetical protein